MRRTFTVKAGDFLLGVRLSPKQAVDLMFAVGLGAYGDRSNGYDRSVIRRVDWRWCIDNGDRVDTIMKNNGLRVQAYRDDEGAWNERIHRVLQEQASA